MGGVFVEKPLSNVQSSPRSKSMLREDSFASSVSHWVRFLFRLGVSECSADGGLVMIGLRAQKKKRVCKVQQGISEFQVLRKIHISFFFFKKKKKVSLPISWQHSLWDHKTHKLKWLLDRPVTLILNRLGQKEAPTWPHSHPESCQSHHDKQA